MARLNDSVSMPTSRWLMIEVRSVCMYSIGSSIVTMCRGLVSLIWSIIAASVVDFPEPVVPVSRISPRSSSASSVITGGSPSSSSVRTANGIKRATIEIEPRWRNAFTRNRASPSTA